MKELQQIDIIQFTHELIKNGCRWQLYEQEKTYSDAEKHQAKLRRIILHDKSNHKRLSIVTTDKQEDIKVITEVRLGRWGSNENTIKYMGERTKLHYNPLIEIV